MTEHELNLSSLPLDIIRLIIRSNIGERMENARLITPTWNILINEYFEELPPLRDLILYLGEDNPHIYLLVLKSHRTHFEKNILRDIIFHERYNMTQENERNLTLLPRDIIRLIIRSNIGERMENARLISPTWNILINQHFEELPSLSILHIRWRADQNYAFISLYVHKKYRCHFEKNVTRDTPFRDIGNEMLRASIKLLTFQSAFAFLTRLFQFTNKISLMYFEIFEDMDVIEHIIKCMRNIEIEGFAIFDGSYQNVQLSLERMCSRHKSNTLEFISRKNDPVEGWGDLIQKFANLLPIIYIYFVHHISEVSTLSWETFAQDLIARTSTNEVHIITQCSSSHYFREPWMEIFHTFREYFDHKLY
ncbi:hypothetical protein PRIPAC_94421 [Pristionchus pacificus]|uniref:Uncharacterized protein n=1 Tax=Pristionchus pacificus TaxID=54126 RepID=A0A2A6BIJ7_PRIPA|nr:hypothetical protein PRIPAC_94421 [Pristionchus pacificus]|eukprot:PDM65707.1 hypothetical protein PRIPAC_45621 [Pristionchus pacificus]